MVIKKAQREIKAAKNAEKNPTEHPTLQLVRIPSQEVIDLGKTAFLRWLESQDYDITNERSRRTAWVRDGGWHLKCCVNLTTGTEDFWLVSFNGKGGELISDKSQRDYRSAYRYLHSNGFTHPQLEGMERGELYQK